MREAFLPSGAARTKVALAKVRESIRQFGHWPPTSAQRHWVALPMPAITALEHPSQRLARLAHERDLRLARAWRDERRFQCAEIAWVFQGADPALAGDGFGR